MIGKKINQLATELAPVSTDLTIIGDPISGVSKKITLAQLGAIFSGAVSFYTNLAGFPATGDINVIYCAKDTQKLYLWSGSAYVEVFPSQALLDTYQLRSEKGVSNGYASLDSTGKVPISQLPSSIMEYKGTWNAATNTPTLANGTGDTGDVYICNVAGTVNFGAGPITFAVGDYVIYSGSIWQRSSGAVGTVTSVAASITGNSIGITGSPVTTSGTLAFAFAGTGAQYIKGDGTLATFPSTISQAEKLITEVYNRTGATLTKGTIVYINGGQGNLPTVTKALATGDSTSAQTFGIVQADITNMNNGYVVVAGKLSDLDTQAYTEGTQLYLSSTTAGTWTSTKQYAPNHLVYVGIVVRAHPTQGIVEIKIQNGYELDELHDVAAQTPTNNDGLFWESATSLWKNKSIATVLGYTPQPQLNGTGFVKASGTTISYDNSTYVTTDTFQTISASKTFSVGLSLASAGGTNQLTSFVNTSSLFSGSAGSNVLGFNSANNIYFGKGSNNGGVLQWTNSTVRYYTLPDATGTIALTSDIPSLTGYVPYTGATSNVNLGTNDLLSRSVYIEGTASYQAGLLMKQISGFNFVTGAYTQVVPSGIYDLYVVHNQTNGTRRRYAISVASLQDGDDFQYLVPRKNGTFAMTSDIPSLTGYVQGSGTTNYLPKFTGTSTIGNSVIYQSGNYIGIGTTAPIISLQVRDSGNTYSGHFSGNDQTNGVAIGTLSSNVAIIQGYTRTFSAINDIVIQPSGGNLGLGVTPSAWDTTLSKAIQLNGGSLWGYSTSQINVLQNAFYNTSGDIAYVNSASASAYRQISGVHSWHTAPSGTAGNAISFTQAMTLDASGRLGIGTTSPSAVLEVAGTSANTDFRISRTVSSSTYFYIKAPGGSPSTSTMGVNGVDVMALNASGNVGIGMTTPNAKLEVTSGVPVSAEVQRWSYNNGNADFSLRLRQDVSSGLVKHVFDVVNNATTYSNNLVLTNGNVGIGTTSPLSGVSGGGLQITNSTAAYVRVNATGFTGLDLIQGTDGTGYLWQRDNNDVRFGTNNTERMRITSGGNVGIGTTSPDRPLDIYSASTVGIARIRANNANGAAITIQNDENSQSISMYAVGSSGFGIGGWAGNAVLESITGVVYSAYNGNHIFQTGVSGRTERMRIKSNGIINLSNVPSSSAGLSSGDVYKTVAGVLMIV